MKNKASICPICGGYALEHPLEINKDPISPEYFTETLQCSECDAVWEEVYEKKYLGYTHDKHSYYEDGTEITISYFIGGGQK